MSDVPKPVPLEPETGNWFHDIAALGWARWWTAALLVLTAVAAFAAPMLHRTGQEILGFGGLITWRATVGSLSAMVGLVFALARGRSTTLGMVLGLSVVLPVLLAALDGVLFVLFIAGDATGRSDIGAEIARDAVEGMSEVAAGLAANPQVFLALLVLGLLPGVLVYVGYAARGGRALVPWPGIAAVAVLAVLRPVTWSVLLAAFGVGLGSWDEGWIIGAIESAITVPAFAITLACAGPARRLLAAR